MTPSNVRQAMISLSAPETLKRANGQWSEPCKSIVQHPHVAGTWPYHDRRKIQARAEAFRKTSLSCAQDRRDSRKWQVMGVVLWQSKASMQPVMQSQRGRLSSNGPASSGRAYSTESSGATEALDLAALV